MYSDFHNGGDNTGSPFCRRFGRKMRLARMLRFAFAERRLPQGEVRVDLDKNSVADGVWVVWGDGSGRQSAEDALRSAFGELGMELTM